MSEPIVSFDEQAIKDELKELVRQTVEDTINALLDEEADELVKAERYERTASREAYRAGHYERKLTTTSGQVTVEMPRLKGCASPRPSSSAAAAGRSASRRRQWRCAWQASPPAASRTFPEAAYQRCTVHFYRNVLSKVPKGKGKIAAAMPKAVHAQEPREASPAKAEAVVAEPRGMRLPAAARVVEEGAAETPSCTAFPMEHWGRMRTNNGIERLNRETRRRTDVAGTFPDGHAALMPVTARPKYVADSEWGSRRYLDVSLLDE